MTSPVLVARFPEDASPPRGRPLIDAATECGCGWVAIRVDESLGGLRATIEAAAAAQVGVLVELADTKGIAELADACAALAPLSVPALRDRLVVVVPGERHGRRLRADARWAPSALDLDGRAGLRHRYARFAPNHHRAQADCDDLVVPAGMYDAAGLGKLAATLKLRGARLFVAGAGRGEAAGLAARGVHGLILDPRS